MRVAKHLITAPRPPYPILVHRRRFETEPVPPGGGTEAFDTPEALAINRARLEHLASLHLPVEGKRVLDVGSGVGHLSQYFVSRGCRVVCMDARQENIASLQSRYPGLEAHVLNVETDPLARFGSFPIVFSYGLLYHLENPLGGLRNMASVCSDMLLLETLVCDQALPIVRFVDETKTVNQALGGFGSRPSPSYVAWAINRVGFEFVYAPVRPPDHLDFTFRWKNNLDTWRDGHPLRCIFVASRRPLENPQLFDLLKER